MYTIRKAGKSDRESYAQMRHELWPDCSEERHKLEIDLIMSSAGFVLLAELPDTKIVGFAELSIRSDHVEGTRESPVPYLEGWYVKSDYQGLGIGKALINAAEVFALEMGFSELASDAELDNTSAIAIHKKIGFREVDRTVHFVKSLKER